MARIRSTWVSTVRSAMNSYPPINLLVMHGRAECTDPDGPCLDRDRVGVRTDRRIRTVKAVTGTYHGAQPDKVLSTRPIEYGRKGTRRAEAVSQQRSSKSERLESAAQR